MGKRLFLGDPSSLPDNLRCRRSDGRQWRCPQPAKPGLSFCEHHYHQVRRNQESTKNANVTAEASADPPLTKKRRREQLIIKDPPVAKLILAERTEEGEMETESSHVKVSMDLPSPDQLWHHQSDCLEWQCSPPALPSLRFCDPHNPRFKQTNEQNTKVTESRPMRRQRGRRQRQNAEASAKEPAMTTQRMQGEGDMETAEPAGTRDLPIPDSLRCQRSDGRKWRCYQPVMPGLRFCEHHGNRNYSQATKLKIIKPEKNSHLPSDPQRFRKWPQSLRRMEGEQKEEGLIRMEQNEEPQEAVKLPTTSLSFCNDSQCREDDTKEYMEGSANPKRKPSKKDLSLSDHLRCRRSDGRKWRCPQLAMPSIGFCEYHCLQMRRNQGKRQNSKLASTAKHKRGQPARKLRQACVRGRLLGDGGTRTKQKIGDKYEDAYLEVTRDLPNGVMAISPWTAMGLANASPSVDWKLGSDYGFLMGRPFRSKNAERVPLATVQFVLVPGPSQVRPSTRHGLSLAQAWHGPSARPTTTLRAVPP
ncbi:Growth-regulating factor 3 [Platanthera guangdongensis]|uniref:Growth-regulating factor 3 n=1 Tax=Platanthera guangdongensis TaxID=2320717 RepID=A0ABR2MYL8_9ASPA